MPSFLQRVDGRSQTSAAFLMGAITVVAGLAGTVIGGFIAQRWSPHQLAKRPLPRPRHRQPCSPSRPPSLCFFGPTPRTRAFTLPSLALAIFFIFLGTGPVNAATVNAVRPEIRATALAGQLFLIHALGDAISPRIIGAVSDHSNLAVGLGSTLITLLIASAIFFLGARYAPPLHISAQTASA